MKKPALFIDTDMGVDDIIAICMIVASDSFRICGISVVNGVSPVRAGVRNLARVLSYLGVSIPLYLGVDQTAQRSRTQFPYIDRRRAKTLVPLTTLPLPNTRPDPQPLTQLARDILAKEPVTMLCLGPLSNIAGLLIRKNIRSAIQRLVVMGGALTVPGNVPPQNVAEYNMLLDPRAADYVVRSGVSTTLVPIDATRFVPAGGIDGFMKEKSQTKTGRIIRAIIKNNRGDFQNFYDPLAAAVLIDPTIILSSVRYTLGISTAPASLGVTQILKDKRRTVSIPFRIDETKFYRLVQRLSH